MIESLFIGAVIIVVGKQMLLMLEAYKCVKHGPPQEIVFEVYCRHWMIWHCTNFPAKMAEMGWGMKR